MDKEISGETLELRPDEATGAEGGEGGVGPGDSGIPEIRAAPVLPGGHRDAEADGDRGDEAAGGPDSGAGGAVEAGEPEGVAGTEVRDHRKPYFYTAHDIAKALRKAIEVGGKHGAIGRAAQLLGISSDAVGKRITGNAQLRALYKPDQGSTEPPPEPARVEVLNRDTENLPSPSGVELAEVVSEADNEILRRGLLKLGVSEKTVKRLKTLDGLAKSSGHFLSISLEKTHRMYFLQLVSLFETADNLRERLKAGPGDEGFIASDEVRAFFNKNYVEMVKESGNGYKLMMEGATAMVKMIQAAKGGEEGGGAKGKPGWGRTGRNVTPKEETPDA